jgi:hypothetical protein
LAARASLRRIARHRLGLKALGGWSWLTDPRPAARNRIYSRTTVSLWRLLRWLFG